MKKSKCINCKYWNSLLGGCVLASQKKEELKRMNYKNMAYNRNDTMEMPPRIPADIKLGEASKFFRKGEYCKWYKFNLINSIMHRIGL